MQQMCDMAACKGHPAMLRIGQETITDIAMHCWHMRWHPREVPLHHELHGSGRLSVSSTSRQRGSGGALAQHAYMAVS